MNGEQPMQINGFRKELTAIPALQETTRPAVLRRSRPEEWIYATDAPLLLSEEARNRLAHELTAAGWEYTEKDGWFFLRKQASEPPEAWYNGSFGPEAACCFSILSRHPHMMTAESAAIQRRLIKAGEEGEKAYEKVCAALHHEWAERLRQKKMLPALSLKYFGG